MDRSFKAKIVNYFGLGNTRTDYPDGSWSWNVLDLKLGRHKVTVIQDRDIVSNKIKPQGCIYTSDIEVSGVKKFEEGERIVNDICCLLSLASFSQVAPMSYSFNGKGRNLSIRAEATYFRPLIEIKCAEVSKCYLEKTWTSYRKNKRIRKLPEVIDMLMVAELPVQPLEIKLAQIFIIMENLKSTYAKKNDIPFCRGFFRKVEFPQRVLHRQPTYKFEELLKLMFSEVNMKPSLRKIIRLRNEIIHFGLSRKPYTSLRKDYDYCHDIVREYLLRLLNYEGNYLLYSSSSRKVIYLNK